jgi:hypothetical protein
MASIVPNLRNININKTCSKTIHLLVEMNSHIIEGLVDGGTSMSIIIISVLRELGIMHLVVGLKYYKTISRVETQAMGSISDLPIQWKNTLCKMDFMVVNTDGYDVLFGLHPKFFSFQK